MRSLPIRVRLALWYSLAIAVAMFSIGSISLWMVHRAIDEIENNELQQRVRSVRRFLESRPPGESLGQARDAMSLAYKNSHGSKWLQVIDERGNWLYRSPHVAGAYPTLALPQNATEAGKYFTYTAESISVSALIAPIAVRGDRYTVQTGLTLDKTLAILSNFRFQLFTMITMGLFVSSIGGYLLSRKALKPVAALAAETRRINDRNLDIRLPVSEARDEISDLSVTMNQMLERIDKAFISVRTFTGNASHELRTPISLLRAEIEVALFRDREVEEYRAILGHMHEETVRMTSLVENLLCLARADGGAEAVAFAPIRVEGLFLQARRTWESAMDRAMLDFRVVAPARDLAVLGDMRAIQRLLSILLENASKYTPPGGLVELSAVEMDDRVVLSVRDSGIGIAPEHRPRIFDRFYRVVASETVPAGSGLGLALGKWIAERHGTELRVESEPGCGASFSFELKRTDSSTPTGRVVRASPVELAEGSPSPPPRLH